MITFDYTAATDWNRWHGGFRVILDSMRLAVQSVPQQIGQWNIPRYYRFGTTGTLQNEPNDGNDAVAGSQGASIAFTGEGVRFRPNPDDQYTFGWLAFGGSQYDTEVVSEYGQGVWGFGTWLKWGPNANTGPQGHLYGFWLTQWVQGDFSPLRERYFGQIYVSPYEELVIVFSRFHETSPWDHYTHYGAFRIIIPGYLVPMTRGRRHHLLFQLRVEAVGGAQALTGELLIDGRLVLKSTQVQGPFWDETYGFNASHQNVPYGPRDTIQIDTGNFATAGIGARRSTSDWPPPSSLPAWVDEMVSSPWNAEVDDVYITRETLYVPGNLEPILKYTSDPAYHWNRPDQNTNWSSGQEIVFTPSRFPNSTQLGEADDSFVLYGPVEEITRPDTAGITKIRVEFTQGTQAGRVMASIRAAPYTYDWNDISVDWSAWNDLTSFNNVLRRIGGGGAGHYVQVRLRILPSKDRTHSEAPAIERVYFETSNIANPENNPPTPPGGSYMWVNGQNSLADTVLVPRTAAGDYQFSWSESTDADADDIPILTYHIQVSSRSDFQPDPYSQVQSVVFEQERITGNEILVPPELGTGLFYWRVRAFDDRQFSDWSSVGTLRVNQPPAAPYDLAVTQIA